MRIGTPQKRGEKAALHNVFYIVLPNSLKYALPETFLWRHSKCAYHISTDSIHYNDE